MKLHDNYPTGQAVPAGFEKLSDLRERIGAEELEKRLQLGVTKSVELITEDAGSNRFQLTTGDPNLPAAC